MKVEIKKISIKDVFFSVFPLAVFVLMLMILFVYNFLCSLGVRGVRVELEDK